MPECLMWSFGTPTKVISLESTTGRQRHGVGKGGDRERGGEGETRNGNGTETGEGGKSGRGKGTMGEGKEKRDRWWGPCTCTRGSTKEEVPIKFGTYNIRNGWNGRLESVLRGMAQANIDLGVFQETKCTDRMYTRESARYRVVATDAPRRHRGGVALFYRPSSLFAVEAVREYGTNVLSFEVATGGRRWYIIGCYLAPDDAHTIERVVTVLGDQPHVTARVVAGDFNTDLGDTASDGRGTEIAETLTEAGVEEMTAHALPRKRLWGRERRTWSMVREGKVIRSQTDYLLGTDRSLI